MVSHNSINRLVQWLDSFSEWSGRIISWLTLLMVLTTFVVVVMRYLFNFGIIAVQESVIYMHSAVFLLGAAYTLKHDGHVRVDIFYRPLSERSKACINVFGTLFLLLPVSIFILMISWEYVATSWSQLEGSQEAGGIPFRYLLKSMLIVMPVMMIMQGLADLGRCLLVLSGQGHLLPADEEHGL